MRAVTVNVSAASPFGDVRRRVAGMCDWAERVLASAEQPSLVFAQECDAEWLAVWRHAGYQVVLGDGVGQPQYKVISAIIAAPNLNLTRVSVADAPSLRYHGSYVAAAIWAPISGESVLVMSVHASPNRAEEYLTGWPTEQVQSPTARIGSGRPSEALWDSDAVLATLRHHARLGDLLAVGDLNEALGWDNLHPGTSGKDYFAAVREARLVSVLHERWVAEQPTRRVDGEDGLQLDHVVATPTVAGWITDPEIDAGWATAGEHCDWSDHAPVWFEITPPGTA